MIEFRPAGKKINKKEKEFLMALGYKWCGCCRSVKLLDAFSLNNSTCKSCQKIKSDKWKSLNSEKVKQTRQQWRDANRDLENQWNKKYRTINQERIRLQERERYAKNAERVRARKKEAYAKNKIKLNVARKARRELYKKDPLFNLAKRLRDRIYGIFNRKNCPKNSTTQKLLGCNWSEAKEHLENQFSDGMSWENMGSWHIDHIVPLASATTQEELIALCHYSNLQPLWAFDNMSKGSKAI
jgi:hypothetical protein